MGDTVGALSIVSRGLLTLLPLAAATATAALVKMGMEAQTQLSYIAGLTGASAEQMKYYTASLETLGVQMGFTLDESAKGLYYVVSAGFQGADAITVLHDAMEHAAASGATLKDVAYGLSGAMNAYGANASQAAKYSDIMTTAVTYGMQTTEAFSVNLNKAALMASSAHVPFTQLAAAEAALTDKSVPAAGAFTYLSFLISKIAVPSADAMAKSVSALGGHLDATKYQSADLMGKLLLLRNATGLTEDEFIKLIGGTRSSKAALGLLSDQGAAYNKILDKMGATSGITAQAFQVHTKTMGFAFDQVKAAISNAGFELVKMISPAAIDFLSKLAVQAGKLPALFHAIGDGAGAARGLFAQLSSFVTGTLIPAIQRLVGWFRDNVLPVLGLVATIIVTQVIPAYLNAEKAILNDLIPSLEHLFNVIKPVLIPALVAIGWTLTNLVIPSIGLMIGITAWLIDKLAGLIGKIGDLLGWLGNLGTKMGALMGPLGGASAGFSNFKDMIGNVAGAIGGLIGKIGDLIGKIGQIHLPDLSGFGNSIGGVLSHIPGLAEGGVTPGGVALVGERGPELALFPRGTRIIPNGQTAALMDSGTSAPSLGAGSGYHTANIYLQIDGRTFARQLAQPLTDVIRLTGAIRGS